MTTPSVLHYESTGFAVSTEPGENGPRVTIKNLTLSPHGWDKPATTTLDGDAARALIASIDTALVTHYDPNNVETSEAQGVAHIDTNILAPLDARLRAVLETQRQASVQNAARVWIAEGVRHGKVALIQITDHLSGRTHTSHTFLPAVDEGAVRDYLGQALPRHDDRPPLSVNDVRIVPVTDLFHGWEQPVKSWNALIAQHEQRAYEAGEEVDSVRLDLFQDKDATGRYGLWGQFHAMATAAGVTVRNGVFDRFDAMGHAGTTVFSVQPAENVDDGFELLLHQNGQAYTSAVTYSSESYAVKSALELEHKFVTPHAQYRPHGFGRLPKDDVLKVDDLVKAWSKKDPSTVMTRAGQRPGTTQGQEASVRQAPDADPLPTLRFRKPR